MRISLYDMAQCPKYCLLLNILLLVVTLSTSCTNPKTADTSEQSNLSDEDSIQAVTLADSGKMLLYQKWDLSNARLVLEEALQLDPGNAGARADLAWHHFLFNQDAQAIHEMQLAVERDPSNPKWPAWLAWIHMRVGNLNQANDAISKSLSMDPDFAEGLHVQSKIAAAKEDFETAIAIHERAAAIDPRWRLALAHTYALSGNRMKATEILATTDESPLNTFGRIEVYLALGEKEKALEWFQQAYNQRHPYLPWCRRNDDLKEIWDTPEFRRLYQTLGIE